MLHLRSPLCPELQDSDFRESSLGLSTLEHLYNLVTGEAPPGKSARDEASELVFARDGAELPCDLLDVDVSLEELTPHLEECGRRYPLGFDGHTIASPGWEAADVFHQKRHCATLSPKTRTFRGTRSTAVLLPPRSRVLGLALRGGKLHLRVFHASGEDDK